MAVHWAAGMMRWQPHQGPDGVAYPLHHLHPLRYDLILPAKGQYSALEVEIRAGFALHTFTRGVDQCDGLLAWRYTDDREVRIFDPMRYQLSKCLPDVVRTLNQRKCYHAKARNFLTLGEPDGLPAGHEYQVYFDLRRWTAMEVHGGRPVVQLIVQSAYAAPLNQAPRGRRRQPVGFNLLISGVVAGRKLGPAKY